MNSTDTKEPITDTRTSQGKMTVYRSEHPNPQFQRNNYRCLNGTWGFAVGKADGKTNSDLDGKIEVPFCPESALSGVHKTEPITDCVYTREIEITREDLNGRLFLHFGAVDYSAEVYVNGTKAGRHAGGYTSFAAEITDYVEIGKNRITVAVHDDVRENVPSGKQTEKEFPFGCFYTRVTGIWQTVWLERTPEAYIKSIKFYPDAEHGSVRTEIVAEGIAPWRIDVTYRGRAVGHAEGAGGYRTVSEIPLAEKHLWEIGNGRLYDVKVRYGDDEVDSYFGLRDLRCAGNQFLLNGKSVFQCLVLDQGYYKDGVYTPATVEDMRRDIALAQSLGFNGARLHQKVFEQRYLYECDKAGFIVWGEYASWGIAYENLDALGVFVGEWAEAVEQNFNHPSIVTWCPLNETWENIKDPDRVRDVRFIESVYAVTKALDPTRPCVDTSGGYHGRNTDIADFHSYESFEILKARMAQTLYGRVDFPKMYCPSEGIGYKGEPLHLSEFGGTSLSGTKVCESVCVCETKAWGYDTAVDEASFVANYIGTVRMLLSCETLSGFCYTQLYDVLQEQNGFFTYERKPKLTKESMDRIAACNRAFAAIEREDERAVKVR